ncbi:MAG: sodium-dependent transporter [Opitutales bacterium]|nr:sodium-dependent transporter [Opitutales bacterium]MCH8540361.1 sodium-dependent transporter [Opitutales bacterium]
MPADQTPENSRGHWGSGLVFIFAAAGSAIGLGNIWRFPISVADGGGGLFLLLYIICILAIGLPVMLAEMVIGRAGQKNPVGAMKRLKPGTNWYLFGLLSVVTGAVITSFYSVVAGWAGIYLFASFAGTFTEPVKEGTAAFFDRTTANVPVVLLAHFLFIGLTAVIVALGIKRGIEGMIKFAMPLFLLLLLALMFRSLTLSGSLDGLQYYLVPRFSDWDSSYFLLALGQAFFSLGLGMGAIITYGSYLRQKENLPNAAVSVVGLDTLIAVLAGLIIFPALFTVMAVAEVEQLDGGAGLIFVVLSGIFHELPMSWLFSVLFFALLLVAALTSSVSLLEAATAYLIDEKGMSRPQAACAIALGAFLLGIPSLLSQVDTSFFHASGMFGWGFSFFSLLDNIYVTIALPVAGLGISLFVGWGWGIENALKDLQQGRPSAFPWQRIWCFMIRYVAPIAILVVLVYNVFEFFNG